MIKTNKEKDLTISGKTISVNLGSGYFYEFFEEVTGIDLIAKGFIETDIAGNKVFKYIQGFIYAGNKAFNAIREKECDMTVERAKHIAYSLSETELMDVFYECLATYSGITVADLKKAQAQATKGTKKSSK